MDKYVKQLKVSTLVLFFIAFLFGKWHFDVQSMGDELRQAVVLQQINTAIDKTARWTLLSDGWRISNDDLPAWSAWEAISVLLNAGGPKTFDLFADVPSDPNILGAIDRLEWCRVSSRPSSPESGSVLRFEMYGVPASLDRSADVTKGNSAAFPELRTKLEREFGADVRMQTWFQTGKIDYKRGHYGDDVRYAKRVCALLKTFDRNANLWQQSLDAAKRDVLLQTRAIGLNQDIASTDPDVVAATLGLHLMRPQIKLPVLDSEFNSIETALITGFAIVLIEVALSVVALIGMLRSPAKACSESFILLVNIPLPKSAWVDRVVLCISRTCYALFLILILCVPVLLLVILRYDVGDEMLRKLFWPKICYWLAALAMALSLEGCYLVVRLFVFGVNQRESVPVDVEASADASAFGTSLDDRV